MPSPRENSTLWDRVVIGKVTLPPAGVNGTARVKAPIKWKNDAKSPKGKTGSRSTTQGRDKSSVKIEIVIQDELTSDNQSQYDLTQAAIDEISGSPGPYGIAHGATDAGRVRDIMIDEISSPEPDAGRISWTIDAHRWDAPDAVIGGTGGSGSGTSAADIAKLEAQYAALENELQINIALQNTNTSIFKAKEAELKALGAKIAQLKSSATKTPDKSDPTKQYYQDGNKGAKPGVPVNEWQP